MKLFKKITALALALVVVAMLGISASAANFTADRIFGDFQAGAVFNGNLTSNTVSAEATFHPNGNELQYQRIQISYTMLNSGGDMYVDSFDESSADEEFCPDPVASPVGKRFISATYRYTAYYIANQVVDCYLSHGPEVLSIP